MSEDAIKLVTFALAVLGSVLGVINTWAALRRNVLRLKVTPGHAIPVGGAPQNISFSIEIVNQSDFPVTICEAGVFYYGTSARGAIINPIMTNGGGWPVRLEPRTSVTVYGDEPGDGVHKIRTAYAKTQCGATKTGNSPALKQIAARAANKSLERTR